MREKYFNNKKTIVCFIIYILITSFIFLSSMMNASISTGQSNIITNTISAVVDFFTKGDVNLKENGKDKELYPESIQIDNIDTIAVGETIEVVAKMLPEKTYTLSKLVYTSSDTGVFSVDYNKGRLTAIAPGSATLKVTDTFSKVTSEQTVTVSPDEVFIPELTFSNVSGFSSQDNNVYFSPSTLTGAIYAVDFETEVIPEKLGISYDSSDVTAVLAGKKVYFYPKRIGDVSFDVVATFDNVNGKNQTHNYTFEVDVKEMALPSITLPFSINTTPVTLPDTDVYNIQTNISQFASANQNALGRVFYTFDPDIVTVEKDGDVLSVKAKELGENSCSIDFYSSFGGELVKQTIDFTIIKGVPSVIEMVAPSKWATVERNLYLSIMGNGKKYDSKDFTWTATGAETSVHEGGLIAPKQAGKITVTATHKTIQGFTVTKEFEVRIDFSVYIRKFIGHFLLFLVLALFAGVVYCRLAYVLLPKKEMLLGSAFALTAGSLTSLISELLQSGLFTAGRAPSFSDVMLNIYGFILGVAIYLLARFIIKKIIQKKALIPN